MNKKKGKTIEMEDLKKSFKTFVIICPGKKKILMSFPITDTLFEVLSAVTLKFYLQSSKYDLRYGNHVLDLETELGYCNLPDCAELELVPGEVDNDPAHIVPVSLILEREDCVFTGKFRPSESLWEIFKQLVPRDFVYNEESVCIRYMSKDVIGIDDLKETKLFQFPIQGRMEFICIRNFNPPHYEVGKRRSTSSDVSVAGISNQSNITLNSLRNSETSDKSTESLTRRSYDNQTQENFENDQTTNENQSMSGVSSTTSYKIPSLLNEVVYLSERYGRIYHSKYMEIVNLNDKREENVKPPKLRSGRREPKEPQQQLIVIKVYLPNDYIVQAKFKPTETVDDVMNFLKRQLKNPDEYFYFHTLYPRLIMTQDRFLKDLKCQPSGMLYFAPTNRNSEKDYLRSDLISSLTGRKVKNYVSWNRSGYNIYRCTLFPKKKDATKRPLPRLHRREWIKMCEQHLNKQ